MLKRRFIVSMLSVGMIVLNAGIVFGQAASTGSGKAYPNRPIRIVTSSIGGGNDFTARQIAQGISGALAQPVIVDNRTSSALVAENVSKATPDGYSLILAGSSVWVIALVQTMGYDIVRDFSPITQVDTSPSVLAVHPSLPVKSVTELIALAKTKPGGLNYSAGPAGDQTYLTTELFNSMAGIKVVHVAYKGGGPAFNGLLTGEVQMGFVTPPAAMPQVKSGKLRALGITSAAASPLVPGVPPIAATLPGYESVAITFMAAPAKTPVAAINRLNQEIVRFLKTPEAKERFFSNGVETVGSSPQELAATIKSDIAKWSKLIKDAGIKGN